MTGLLEERLRNKTTTARTVSLNHGLTPNQLQVPARLGNAVLTSQAGMLFWAAVRGPSTGAHAAPRGGGRGGVLHCKTPALALQGR